jgi:hypothetical protein
MFRRRLSVAIALGATLAAATACASPISSNAVPAPKPKPTASMPAPGQLMDSVKTATQSASAVHVKGSVSDSGTSVVLDLQLNKDGSASGTFGEGGTTVPVIVTTKADYIQFTSDLMTANGISPTSTAGTLLLNKWVDSTSKLMDGTDMVSAVKPLLDYNTFVNNIISQIATDTPKPAGAGTVGGTAVEMYTLSDGTKMDITRATPHYLVQLSPPASEGAGQLDFTGWNKPVTVTAPPASEIYSGPGA